MVFNKTFYKKTDEDWYPSYELEYQGRQKLVSIHYSQRPDGVIIISIFGADDHALSIEPKNIEEAEEIIQKIIDVKTVNHGWLEELGFDIF